MNKHDRKKANKLINEKSPYLLQHAYNPVEWFPWGVESFELAARENKPVFLSIGYSTCHWCHVMEKESFEDDEVARLMNEVFVSIKVDREERPDIDNIYMKICQMLTGRGGWPMTIIMTPNKRPFFAGTYFPKESKYGRIGMLDLIKQVKDIWVNKHEDIEKSAEQIIDSLNNLNGATTSQSITTDILGIAYDEYVHQYDELHGGFGNSPKFPIAHNLMFLLRYFQQNKNDNALAMVENTLSGMMRGGIYDHVGFGFHRYSTDREWLLPHFEKMLYDQSLISMAYTEAFLATGNVGYKETALEIYDYVLRDMMSQEGGFYSAEDADSEGIEGKFYTWDVNEIKALLEPQEAEKFIEIYNLSAEGNYIDESAGEKSGLNIPHLKTTLERYANDYGIAYNELKNIIRTIKHKLLVERGKRIHPFKDDKILTDWNGLIIASLGKSGRAFDNNKLINAAVASAEFILTNMKTKDGLLLHRYKDGEAGITANADDYAFLIWGLLELYQATFNTKYLAEAIELNNTFIKHFWDKEHGGFYFTPDFGEKLLVRLKEIYDGAIPSANSVSLNNMVVLSLITGKTEYSEYIDRSIKTFSSEISRMPSSYAQFLSAFTLYSKQSKEVVIVGEHNSDDTKKMVQALNSRYLPDVTIVLVPSDKKGDLIYKLAPHTKSYSKINDKTTAYICVNRECNLPTNNIEEMLQQLTTS